MRHGFFFKIIVKSVTIKNGLDPKKVQQSAGKVMKIFFSILQTKGETTARVYYTNILSRLKDT